MLELSCKSRKCKVPFLYHISYWSHFARTKNWEKGLTDNAKFHFYTIILSPYTGARTKRGENKTTENKTESAKFYLKPPPPSGEHYSPVTWSPLWVLLSASHPSHQVLLSATHQSKAPGVVEHYSPIKSTGCCWTLLTSQKHQVLLNTTHPSKAPGADERYSPVKSTRCCWTLLTHQKHRVLMNATHQSKAPGVVEHYSPIKSTGCCWTLLTSQKRQVLLSTTHPSKALGAAERYSPVKSTGCLLSSRRLVRKEKRTKSTVGTISPSRPWPFWWLAPMPMPMVSPMVMTAPFSMRDLVDGTRTSQGTKLPVSMSMK